MAMVQLGRPKEALTLLADQPDDCNYCLGVKAMAASRLGDVASSERWFIQAERQWPGSLIMRYWALERLARRDYAGTIKVAARAHKAAPRYADPLEIWGEALLGKGDALGAARKFETAVQLAPRWGRLQLKWGEALVKLSKMNEARAKWTAAAGMDLKPSERVELVELLRGQTR